MSYILDALRRADAERERGRVPGLNAQAIDLVADEPGRRRRGLAPWVWALFGAAGVIAALVLAWVLLQAEDAPPAPLAATSPAAPATPPTWTPPPLAAVPAGPPAARDAAARTGERAGERSAAAPTATAEAPARAAVPRKPPQREAQVARRTPGPDAPAADEAPATPWAELPEDFRRSVPRLAIDGSSYSPNPASRVIIVNGLVHREGDEPMPGVTIRQIKLRSAVFEYRGQRYEVGF
jgi:general secretion pathway protein B